MLDSYYGSPLNHYPKDNNKISSCGVARLSSFISGLSKPNQTYSYRYCIPCCNLEFNIYSVCSYSRYFASQLYSHFFKTTTFCTFSVAYICKFKRKTTIESVIVFRMETQGYLHHFFR